MNYKFPYRDLIGYQKGRVIVKEVYEIVRLLPSEERYALGDQLRRAAVSITSNIAEGSGRISMKDQAHFIEMSYGSLMEVLSQMEVALDLGYISKDKFEHIEELIAEESRILSGFRLSLLKKI